MSSIFGTKMQKKGIIIIVFITCLVGVRVASAQLISQSDKAQQIQLNTITTAVPFLMIAPDSRSGALGDAGVALSPDANSVHWNISKLAFSEKPMEFSLSYSPWLRSLVNDMSLSYLSGYKKLNKNTAVGGSLRYFSLGTITFTDEYGTTLRDFTPKEFAIDYGISQRLNQYFGVGFTGRFINSNLTGSTNIQGAESKPGRTGAVDLSGSFINNDLRVKGKKLGVAAGINISNIGAKMRYTNTANRDFIPMNLKLGGAATGYMDEFNKLTFTLDLNKLLVPTPPIYDSTGTTILSGMDRNVGVATGMIQSFYDAPGQIDANGNVVKGSIGREELREINISTGLEYWYADQFAVRAGYFYEDLSKGNRQFITVGAGLKYQVLTIDMSYLVSTTQQNPLANTLRFTLRFAIGDKSNTSDTPEE
jgi:Type IX secretion system protein PorV